MGAVAQIRMLVMHLFTHRDLWTWIDDPFDISAAHPDDPNLPLDLEMPEKKPRKPARVAADSILDSISNPNPKKPPLEPHFAPFSAGPKGAFFSPSWIPRSVRDLASPHAPKIRKLG